MKGKFILGFIFGAAAGFGAGYYVTKTVLTKQNEADLEEVRGYYAEKLDALTEVYNKSKSQIEELESRVNNAVVSKAIAVDEPKKTTKKKKASSKKKENDISEVEKIIEKCDYTSYSEQVKEKPSKKKKEITIEPDEVCVIEPDDFTENVSGFEQMTLTYLNGSGIYLDAQDEEYPTGHDEIPDAFLARAGEYEDDVLYVSNATRECDYEIIIDSRTYEDYMADEHGC